MKKSVESPFAWIVVFSLTMFGFVPHALAGPAADVLKLYGRGQGLCVVIGCGSQATPALAAELASAAPVVVHGIALDDASLARAQAAVDAAGVQGLATVERLPLAPLPYRDNLANLVVVEDGEAAAKAGFTKEEALRVLAPGGTLLTRSGGTWDAAVKPWPKEMDEWTHESHGPDGNCVSNDTVVKFPVGYRWHAGLPMNLQQDRKSTRLNSSHRLTSRMPSSA
jgi:SAM-dependent methyltransferase